MVLAIDIGNSNIVIGGYKDDKIEFMGRVATDRYFEADQYAIELRGLLHLYGVKLEHVEGVVLSSVVPTVTDIMLRALEHFTQSAPHVLSLDDAKDIPIDIYYPGELGMDLLAGAIAVRHTVELPAVVIDMGTATKLVALDKDGHLPGVTIAPGLFVSLDALVGEASQLRGIALESPRTVLGKNSAESMQSGVVLGSADMLDGLLDRFDKELGGIKSIVATGGAAPTVIPYCRHHIDYRETLLLDGLYTAYKNRK